MSSIFRYLFFSLIALIILGAITGQLALQYFSKWSLEPLNVSPAKIIEFPRGTQLKSLSAQLEQQQLVTNALLFRLWVRAFEDYSKFQAGSYRFEGNVSPVSIINAIQSGDTYVPVVLQFTIPEGFTLKKIIARLVAQKVGSLEEFNALAADKAFRASHNIKSKSLEGYLYPATYSFSKFPTAKEAFSQMIDTFWSKLPKDYEEQVNALGLSLNEAVIFASLIELETRLEDEKPMISEVIWKRLKSKVALAIDASIIYGIKDYDGNLRWRHLKDKTNPYNTRMHRGLPPTPIGSPAISSLMAVLNPSDYGYFYYVLDLKDGSRHNFSKSIKEHNIHVNKLRAERRRQRKAGR